MLVRALRLHGWAVLVILLDVTNKRTNLSALGQKVVEEFAESNFRLDRDPLSNELCMVQVKKQYMIYWFSKAIGLLAL